MKKNILLAILSFLFVVFILYISEQYVRIVTKHDEYYLPARLFWQLEKYTNLFNQRAGKSEYTLYYTGVPWRQDVVKVKKPEGVKRIITVGTSSTEGFGVEKSDTFLVKLENMLNSKYGEGKAEVINGAVGGYVSYQLLIYFKEILLKLSPDIVILYLGWNESYNGNITDREYYEIVRKMAVKAGDDKEEIAKIYKYGINASNPFYIFLAESRLFGYIFIKLNECFDSCFPFGRRRCPDDDSRFVLNEFARLSKEYNFKLIFVPEVPKRNRLSENYCLLMKSVAPGKAIFIDILPVLRSYPKEDIFLDPIHLTPYGHSIFAEILFNTICEIF